MHVLEADELLLLLINDPHQLTNLFTIYLNVPFFRTQNIIIDVIISKLTSQLRYKIILNLSSQWYRLKEILTNFIARTVSIAVLAVFFNGVCIG